MLRLRRVALVVSLFVTPAAFAARVPGTSPAQQDNGQIAPEYNAFALRMEKAIGTGQGLPKDGFLDRNRVLDRALKGYEDTGDVANGFRKGFLSAQPLEVALRDRVANGDSTYKFLRVRRIGGEIRAVFRLLGSSGAVTYNDWILEKNGSGQVVPVDVYLASSGEKLSETARGTFERYLAAQPGLMQQLAGKHNELVDATPKIIALGEKSREGKFEEALTLAHQIPPEIARTKPVMVARLQIATGLKAKGDPAGEREYQAVLTDFQKAYPGDPALDLLALDELLAEKKFDQAFQGLDRLDAFTGGDAHLEFLRASLLISRNGPHDMDAATTQLEHAIAREPTLANPYWAMVNVSLQRKDYASTVRWLDTIERKLNLQLSPDAMQKSEPYQGFVKSAAFKKWAAAHAD